MREKPGNNSVVEVMSGKSGKSIAAAATVFMPTVLLALLTLPAAAATTQAEFDGAVGCCWTGNPSGGSMYGWCYPNNACGRSQSTCYSKYFKDLDIGNNGWMQCSTMTARGGDLELGQASSSPPLFVAPRGQTVSPRVAQRLSVVTAVVRLQSMAAVDPSLSALRDSDMGAAFEEIGASLPQGVSVSFDRDEASGYQVVTIEGLEDEAQILLFDDDGKRIDEPAE